MHIEMDYAIAAMVLALLLYAAWAAATTQRHRRLEELRPLPPGPKPWPVVGNIFQLAGNSSAPHQSFAKLADQYGAVMTLHLGSMNTVVISSSTAARAMFRHHDAVFAGRTIYESMKGEIGNEGSLITAQYGPHCRMLRRLCTAEFFAAAPLDAMRGVRAKCVDGMVQYIRDASSSGSGGVDVGRFFFLMAFNLIGNLIFSKDLLDPKSERGAKFFYHAGKATEFAGKPNVADFLPVLKRVDPQGIRRRTQYHVKQAFDVAGEFLRERMREMGNGSGYEKRRKDYLDVLLEYKGDGVEGPHAFSSTIINVIVFEERRV
ncbi:cytochrome p450 76a2 [Phtheirospermum japonicum]|uniref:Cytochrome p450 76a2 n=1 Tax=Phtheirospermum japonicum TaxID=374723 RepID=A0A830CLA6_9LAMI|nr:cytochrome p450 76a2 [Phtheirospermum japonicum]